MLNPIRNMMLVLCREVVLLSEGLLSEARLYFTNTQISQVSKSESPVNLSIETKIISQDYLSKIIVHARTRCSKIAICQSFFLVSWATTEKLEAHSAVRMCYLDSYVIVGVYGALTIGCV